MSADCTRRRCDGSLFHARGPAAAKERSLMMTACVALRRSSTQQISDRLCCLQQQTGWWHKWDGAPPYRQLWLTTIRQLSLTYNNCRKTQNPQNKVSYCKEIEPRHPCHKNFCPGQGPRTTLCKFSSHIFWSPCKIWLLLLIPCACSIYRRSQKFEKRWGPIPVIGGVANR